MIKGPLRPRVQNIFGLIISCAYAHSFLFASVVLLFRPRLEQDRKNVGIGKIHELRSHVS
jgi:hypothetical protein